MIKIKKLKQSELSQRSAEEKAKVVTTSEKRTMAQTLKAIKRLQKKFRGRKFSDSTPLIRADRER